MQTRAGAGRVTWRGACPDDSCAGHVIARRIQAEPLRGREPDPPAAAVEDLESPAGSTAFVAEPSLPYATTGNTAVEASAAIPAQTGAARRSVPYVEYTDAHDGGPDPDAAWRAGADSPPEGQAAATEPAQRHAPESDGDNRTAEAPAPAAHSRKTPRSPTLLASWWSQRADRRARNERQRAPYDFLGW